MKKEKGKESEVTDSDENRWVTQTINLGLKLGGKQVDEDHYQERLKICRFCDKAGTVEIDLKLKSIFLKGCVECGCPFSTKPRWQKYWSFIKMKFVTTTCPHPKGNKWAFIDNFFKQKSEQ